MAKQESVGFIGLGNIGSPMAENLISAGFAPWVFDINKAAVAELGAKGAHAAESLAALAEECGIICLCVRDEADVEQVLTGEAGIFEHAREGALIVIHSTVTPRAIDRWAGQAQARGLSLIDAPITGGAAGASARKLCYMVGGEKPMVERCRAVFEASAERTIHTGALGTGIALKLCNNLMAYAAFVAMHEGSKLAEACGLSIDLLREVGQTNGVVTPQMLQFIESRNALRVSAKPADFVKILEPFGVLGEKDLDAALATANALDLEMPGTERIRELIRTVFLKGY